MYTHTEYIQTYIYECYSLTLDKNEILMGSHAKFHPWALRSNLYWNLCKFAILNRKVYYAWPVKLSFSCFRLESRPSFIITVWKELWSHLAPLMSFLIPLTRYKFSTLYFSDTIVFVEHENSLVPNNGQLWSVK